MSTSSNTDKRLEHFSMQELLREAARRDPLYASSIMAGEAIRAEVDAGATGEDLLEKVDNISEAFRGTATTYAQAVRDAENPDQALKLATSVAMAFVGPQNPSYTEPATRIAQQLDRGARLTLMQVGDEVDPEQMSIPPSRALLRVAEAADAWRQDPEAWRTSSETAVYDLNKNWPYAVRLEQASRTLRAFVDKKGEELDVACGFSPAETETPAMR